MIALNTAIQSLNLAQLLTSHLAAQLYSISLENAGGAGGADGRHG
jgi:hypothetical protein